MELTWLDPAHLDDGDLASAVAVTEAARGTDCPHEPGPTVSSLRAHLRHGWEGDPPELALAREGGRVCGLLEVTFSPWDNHHLGRVGVTVDPLARRRGVGRHLLGIGRERVRAAGRSLLVIDGFGTDAALGFAEATGLQVGSEEAQRRQELTGLDEARLAGEEAAARAEAGGYELLPVAGDVPEELVGDVVELSGAINDAPLDDLEMADEVFSRERLRAFEAAQAAQGLRVYRLLARERGTGRLAGHTIVAVDGERPWRGEQYDTSVLRAHRGHRLGLLLKVGMLRWLARAEPQLRTLDTWNATSNTHMVAVNELLGYRVVATGFTWQQHLERDRGCSAPAG